MSMLSVLIKDLVEKTTLEDGTYLVAGTTDANKITFLNLVNAIKKKLGAAAQKSVANNLTTAEAGTSVLDAYQGKLLSDKIGSLNSTSIKETGSSKGWIYRKWCDGTVELWWNSNVTYSNPVGAGVTGLTLASVDIPLPFTISNGMAVASATWYFSEWAQASINTKSATHVTVRKFGNVNSQNLPVQGVYIYVRGTI